MNSDDVRRLAVWTILTRIHDEVQKEGAAPPGTESEVLRLMDRLSLEASDATAALEEAILSAIHPQLSSALVADSRGEAELPRGWGYDVLGNWRQAGLI